MLDHLLNKKIYVSIALNTQAYMGLRDNYKGVLESYDDKFMRLDNGAVIPFTFVRYIEAI